MGVYTVLKCQNNIYPPLSTYYGFLAWLPLYMRHIRTRVLITLIVSLKVFERVFRKVYMEVKYFVFCISFNELFNKYLLSYIGF